MLTRFDVEEVCARARARVNARPGHLKRDLPETAVAMAGVMQKMANGEVSVVMITRSPLTARRSPATRR